MSIFRIRLICCLFPCIIMTNGVTISEVYYPFFRSLRYVVQGCFYLCKDCVLLTLLGLVVTCRVHRNVPLWIWQTNMQLRVRHSTPLLVMPNFSLLGLELRVIKWLFSCFVLTNSIRGNKNIMYSSMRLFYPPVRNISLVNGRWVKFLGWVWVWSSKLGDVATWEMMEVNWINAPSHDRVNWQFFQSVMCYTMIKIP